MKPELTNVRVHSTKEQFKQLIKLLEKINIVGNWHQRNDIVSMSFEAKQIAESLEEKLGLNISIYLQII